MVKTKFLILKQCLLLVVLFSVLNSFGQQEFIVENTSVKLEKCTKSYSFYYYYSSDSLHLSFSDSIVTDYNFEDMITKEVTYSNYNDDITTRIFYYRKDGLDSISKHFYGDLLSAVYETKYDDKERVVYYGMEDYKTESSYRSFSWKYEYRDSITEAGRFQIKTMYRRDKNGVYKYDYKEITQFDNKGRVKSVEQISDDQFRSIKNYTYNEKDSLVEEKQLYGDLEFVNTESYSTNNSRMNTLCDQKHELALFIPNFTNINKVVILLMKPVGTIVSNEKCKDLFYEYTTLNNEISIYISYGKHRDYRRVNCTVTEVFD